MRLTDPDRRSMVSGLLFSAIGAGFLLDSIGLWEIDFVYIWPVALISFGLAAMLGRARRLRVEEVQTQQLAVAEDRVRVAQELHDIVAHSVSLMTVQITAARRVYAKRPEEAEKALAAAEETGRQSLSELRKIIGVLRSADESIEAATPKQAETLGEDGPKAPVEEAPRAPLPSLRDIPSLVEKTRGAGFDIHLVVTGTAPEVPPAFGLAVYRVVQEALTNAMRHAGDAQVIVSVEHTPDSVHISVVDNGVNAAADSGTGHGLSGMRERAESVGGIVTAGPGKSGRGWIVDAEFPLPGTTE